MRNRAVVAAAVVAFAVGVGVVAVVAGRGGGGADLVRLPAATGSATGTADAAAPTAERSIGALAPVIPLDYTVKGSLPDLPSSAAAYRLPTDTTADAVKRLAAALGVDGEPQPTAGGWVVHDAERSVQVMKAPGAPWSLSRCPEAMTVSSDGSTAGVVKGCEVAAAIAGSGGTAVDLPATSPQPAPCPADATCAAPPATAVPEPVPGTKPVPDAQSAGPPLAGPPVSVVPPDQPPARPDLPSREEATRVAKEAFARLGAGDQGFQLEDSWSNWSARVDGLVDGAAVPGLGTWLGIGPGGVIEYGSGMLARPERLGDYPLVSVQAGLDRLRRGFGAGVRPMAADGTPVRDGVVPPAVAVAPAEPGPPVTIEQPVPAEPPVTHLVITGAHLTLLQVGDALVPAFAFDLESGGTTSPVPAVTDQWLDQQARSLPQPAKG
ncbi:MAG TPA: hypothetical protein VFJ85_13670 [Acidimicrobiales bacterium]|nr:hypothetical protein [Acidimicrobiales bacterium]